MKKILLLSFILFFVWCFILLQETGGGSHFLDEDYMKSLEGKVFVKRLSWGFMLFIQFLLGYTLYKFLPNAELKYRVLFKIFFVIIFVVFLLSLLIFIIGLSIY